MPEPNLTARIEALELEVMTLKNGGLFLAKGIDERRDAQAGMAHIIAGQQLVMTVLFRLLALRGAVPAQEAITALVGVRETLSDEDKKGPRAAAIDFQVDVLKSLDSDQRNSVRH
jgi:hypothetical protein